MEQSKYLQEALSDAVKAATLNRSEFITPEHVLSALMQQDAFKHALCYEAGASEKAVLEGVYSYLSKLERVPRQQEYELTISNQLNQSIKWAYQAAAGADVDVVSVPHFVNAILRLPDSYAHSLLESNIQCSPAELMGYLVKIYELEDELDEAMDGTEAADDEEQEEAAQHWKRYVSCLNDRVHEFNPLIGREKELERTLQVLCRKDKNNPLHVGESGVGKTALTRGLAALLCKGKVPKRLEGYKIWELDLNALLAGSSYRGEFEKRMKGVLDALQQQGKAIVYIDDVHNMVGAGQMEGSLDASQILRPYMEEGELRFIGSTTYTEMNRYMSRQPALLRRFQQIDVGEPSVEETVRILKGVKKKYQDYHHVSYAKGTIEYAALLSDRHIKGRALPDKAIDLLDEAGAWRETHPTDKARQVVDKDLLNEMVARMCNLKAEALREQDNNLLRTLGQRIGSKIYGQDEAVAKVVQAVEMAKAGLTDGQKPMASMLFVGPTGVGKTEVSRVLAQELGVELIRFDMSEYTEKHTVAKLIGSPAGYIGYEDGGLLTDAIRKSPNCVLLLDEIEKAHSDIYNILLQVMDYGKLTDNRGNKADFSHVVIIMTSNAGAQHASQASVGFASTLTTGEAMLKEVKRIFKPEFLNRLSSTVVFRDMDRPMAELILDKKLGELKSKLTTRNVNLTLAPAARDLLLERGYSRQYGAREMDRTIESMLVPLLTREILYGKLRRGGDIVVEANDLLAR